MYRLPTPSDRLRDSAVLRLHSEFSRPAEVVVHGGPKTTASYHSFPRVVGIVGMVGKAAVWHFLRARARCLVADALVGAVT